MLALSCFPTENRVHHPSSLILLLPWPDFLHLSPFTARAFSLLTAFPSAPTSPSALICCCGQGVRWRVMSHIRRIPPLDACAAEPLLLLTAAHAPPAWSRYAWACRNLSFGVRRMKQAMVCNRNHPASATFHLACPSLQSPPPCLISTLFALLPCRLDS